MLINTFLDTEDFVHLYYPEDEPAPAASHGCGAGARLACKYTARPPSPDYTQVNANMTERERVRAPPPPEPPPHRVRAADLYPRKRTHYDEPDLDVPFFTICGEFVQWVGRTDDSGTVAMSNYRFHTQPRRRSGPGTSVPLRVIDSVEVRDIVHLHIFCKDGRTLKCTFSNGEKCAEWWRRLTNALTPLTGVQDTFAAAYSAWAREQPPASIHRELMRASHGPNRHWFGPELERLGFTSKGVWRVTTVNSDFKICSSYPPLLVVPACIGDEDLDSVARFRAMRRVPAVVWRHRGNGAVIARASQPEVGWLGWRSSEDERLLAAFVTACSQDRGLQPPNTSRQIKLLIIDARSYTSAVTNRARGGGCECAQYYPAADIQFMCLANIHNVRKSFQQLRQLVAEPAEQTNWHSGLERTLWLQYLSGLGRAAALAARAVLAGRPVLVHCSDGWDRTPQIVSAAQLILDPFYRTIQGFRVLIEREWLDFGHKFADRCGHPFCTEEPNEKSPIFLQWLDLVHQIMIQYPCSFEFSEAYLIKLITHAYSCMFGTFLCNGPKERSDHRITETTAQVWKLLEGPAYRNHLYCAPTGEQVLWPEYNVRSLHLWSALFMGVRVDCEDDCEVEQSPIPPPTAPNLTHAPLMTKTRSCDDLLNDCERRTTQRRCSDPNLVPDVMKLSTMLSASESCSSMSRGEVRGVTDSYVDGMAPPSPLVSTPSVILETSTDQVDGINPNHFENGAQCVPRNIASNSSSLERELVDTQMIRSDHTLVDGANNAEPTTPEEQTIFIEDTYSDVVNMTEAMNYDVQPSAGRMRHISITWRSVSESSHQTDSSAGFDLTEVAPRNRIDSTNQSTSSITNNGSTDHESSPLDNHNSTAGDEANHNVMNGSATLTNHNRIEPAHRIEERSEVTNGGDVPNGKEIDEVTRKLLADELVITHTRTRTCSSGASSESEAEGSGDQGGLCRRRCGVRAGARARATSQHTLCPGSPRMCFSCYQNGVSKCGDTDGRAVIDSISCVCGATQSSSNNTRDPLDGLPPALAPLQARLHTIILNQKIALEQLTSELRVTRAALQQRLSPATNGRHPMSNMVARSVPGTVGISSRSSSSSTSGSEVEVGEEAKCAVWLPDSAAPRCQYCRNHFWLARRRHHCRKCGGIFCSSCSEVGALEEWPSVRVCRLCRTQR